jgi:hypothetical protein
VASAFYYLYVFFAEILENGIYSTAPYPNIGDNEQHVLVEVQFDEVLVSAIADTGGEVYVVENENGTIKVIFFDLIYPLFSQSILISGNLLLE